MHRSTFLYVIIKKNKCVELHMHVCGYTHTLHIKHNKKIESRTNQSVIRHVTINKRGCACRSKNVLYQLSGVLDFLSPGSKFYWHFQGTHAAHFESSYMRSPIKRGDIKTGWGLSVLLFTYFNYNASVKCNTDPSMVLFAMCYGSEFSLNAA